MAHKPAEKPNDERSSLDKWLHDQGGLLPTIQAIVSRTASVISDSYGYQPGKSALHERSRRGNYFSGFLPAISNKAAKPTRRVAYGVRPKHSTT